MKISINIKASNPTEQILIKKAVDSGEFIKIGVKPFRLNDIEHRFECENSIYASMLISLFLYLENQSSK
jgi:hypothetical protein